MTTPVYGMDAPAIREGLSRAHARVIALAAGLTIGACASSTDVVSVTAPGIYQVAATAVGDRMAWARAHQLALQQARKYCEQRGLEVSIDNETTRGIRALEEHSTLLRFQCHAKF